jgi:folate-binding protein YgfZ
MTGVRSTWLDHAGAVAADAPDEGVASHYGDPFREQRSFLAGSGAVDRSNRDVVRITGEDRVSWLHSLTTQDLTALKPGFSTVTLVLSPQGRVEHVLELVDDGTTTWIHLEPGAAAGLIDFLQSMKFMMRVEVEDLSSSYAVVTVPRGTADGVFGAVKLRGRVGTDLLVLHEDAAGMAEVFGGPVGMWAYEALRIAAHDPRPGLDTDDRTLPHEVGWIGTAVHLNKGCYRGQETVARVHNVGHPPRRIVMLHLDGSAETLPAHGDPVVLDGQTVGEVGSAARHFELGPIGLAVIKRTVPVDADLTAGGVPAGQEVIVKPDAGLGLGSKLREEFRGSRSLL